MRLEDLLQRGFAIRVSHRGSISLKEALNLAQVEADATQFPMAVVAGQVSHQDWQIYGLAWSKLKVFDGELVIYPQLSLAL